MVEEVEWGWGWHRAPLFSGRCAPLCSEVGIQSYELHRIDNIPAVGRKSKMVSVSIVSTARCVQVDVLKYCRYDFFRTLKTEWIINSVTCSFR